MGFRRCHFDHNGCLLLVHDQNYFMAVRCTSVFSIVLMERADGGIDAVTSTKFRKQANAADNRAATMSVDSLINYEAVKVRALSLSLSRSFPFPLELTKEYFFSVFQ